MSGRTIFILKTVTGCINPLSGFTRRESALRYGRASHSDRRRGRESCRGRRDIYSLKRGCSTEIRLGTKPRAGRQAGRETGLREKRTRQNETVPLGSFIRGRSGRPGQRSRHGRRDLLRVSPLWGAAEGAGVGVAAVPDHHPHLHHRGELRGPRAAGAGDVRQPRDARAWSVLRIH